MSNAVVHGFGCCLPADSDLEESEMIDLALDLLPEFTRVMLEGVNPFVWHDIDEDMKRVSVALPNIIWYVCAMEGYGDWQPWISYYFEGKAHHGSWSFDEFDMGKLQEIP